MKKLFIILLFCLGFISVSFSEDIDETIYCEEVKKIIISNKSTFKNNNFENLATTADYFGIELDFIRSEGDWDSFVIIDKIHPKLQKVLKEDNMELFRNDTIYEINGKKVSDYTEESFNSQLDMEYISFKIKESDKIYTLKKRSYGFVPLFLDVEADNLSNIDTKNSSFNIDITIITSVEDLYFSTLLDESDLYDNLGIDPQTHASDTSFSCLLDYNFILENYHFPNIGIKNFTSNNNHSQKFIMRYFPLHYCEDENYVDCHNSKQEERGYVFLELSKRYTGFINNNFELFNFPFDSQNLKIEFTSLEDPIEVYESEGVEIRYFDVTTSSLAEDYLYNFKVNTLEWEVFKPYYIYSSNYNHNIDASIPSVILSIPIERFANYYIFKIFVPVLLLLIISWTVFWVDPRELQSRVTISVVGLLSLIAYNFVIDADLPKLSYLTLMDNLILLSYVFAGLPTIQSVLCKYYVQKNKIKIAYKLDIYCKFYMPPCYLLSFAMLLYQNEVTFNFAYLLKYLPF